MPLIYAGGRWRNLPDSVVANVQPFNAEPFDPFPGLEQGRAPQPAAQPMPGPAFDPKPPPTPKTDTTTTDPYAYERERDRIAKKAAQDQVIGTLKTAFADYGLGSLYGQIEKWARQNFTADAALLELRKTPEYKARFPAMQPLSSKGRGITEAEYISFERSAVRLEREYGLPAGMLGDDSVTTLLTNEVSARELQDRVVMASNASQQVPDAMRTQFTKFYGVEQGGLAAYFLDPARAMPLLERQYAMSNIAGQGLIQGVDTTREIAGELFEAGVTEAEARRGFGQVAKDSALTQGKNNTLTQANLTKGTFGNQAYADEIRRARNAEVGQYAGGGSFVTSNEGASGIGKSQR